MAIGAPQSFQWDDPLSLSGQISEDERAVRDIQAMPRDPAMCLPSKSVVSEFGVH